MKIKKKTTLNLIALISLILIILGLVLPSPYGMICEIIAATALFVVGIIKWIVPSKKSTLLKLIMLLALYLSLLSWSIPTSVTQGIEVVDTGISRVSIIKFFEYGYYSFSQFLEPLLFILAVGGLYGVLSETGKFRNKMEKIAKSLKGKGNIFIVVTSLIISLLSSLFGIDLLLFVFTPIICGIIILMGYDKITAFLVAFISPLVGTLGSTYNPFIASIFTSEFSLELSTEIIAKFGLFALTFLVFIAFVIKHANNSKTNEKETKEEKEELEFLGEKKQSKKASWPIYLVLGLILVLLILGCVDWYTLFNETQYFVELNDTVMKWTIGDHTIMSYLFGSLNQFYFGIWSFLQMTILVVIASLLLTLMYNIKIEDALKAFGKGVGKVAKPAVICALAYIIVYITYNHAFLVTITDWMISLTSNLSGVLKDIVYIIIGGLNTIISSVFNIDFEFVYMSSGQLLSNSFLDNINTTMILSQAFYGLTLFVAPTSTLMILGLEYLGIPYKEWLKTSWKLLLQILAVIIVVILVVLFI